jgi:hypothetical protein
VGPWGDFLAPVGKNEISKIIIIPIFKKESKKRYNEKIYNNVGPKFFGKKELLNKIEIIDIKKDYKSGHRDKKRDIIDKIETIMARINKERDRKNYQNSQ